MAINWRLFSLRGSRPGAQGNIYDEISHIGLLLTNAACFSRHKTIHRVTANSCGFHSMSYEDYEIQEYYTYNENN
jgi:hypothetical protein